MSLFNVTAVSARLHKYLPKHGKAEDAAPTSELQFRNVAILPAAAAAVLLAEGGGAEVQNSFFVGDPSQQRFFGIDEISCGATYKGQHVMEFEELATMKVTLIEKIRLRFEGGPQKLIWADFSLHIDDPTPDEGRCFHEMINRDVHLVLKQSADLVDQMLAEKKGMAVTTEINGDLDLDGNEERDAAQLQQAADALSSKAA